MSDNNDKNSDDKKEEIVINLGDMFSGPGGGPVGNSDDIVDAMTKNYKGSAAEDPEDPSEADPYNTRYSILEKASTQVVEDQFTYGLTADDVAEPPYDLSRLANLNEISYVRKACVEAIAQNTVGLGYRIKKIDPKAETIDSDETAEDIVAQLEKWSARGEKTFTELMHSVKTDEESVGNGYIEVSRNRLGHIDGLYHIPGDTMRLRRDQSGYIQQRGDKQVGFYRFGDKVKILSDGTVQYLEDRDPLINEIIHFKLYPSRSQYYGIPRDVSTIVTIAGDEMARNHNIKFFTHSAVPDLLLIFEIDRDALPTEFGDAPVKLEIPQKVKTQILEHFRRNLSSQYFEPGLFYMPQGIKIRVERISQGQKDSGWVNYRQENRNEIRMAFRVPPVMIGDITGSGYATAAIEKSLFLEQVVVPEQRRYEQRLMRILWPEMLMIHGEMGPPIIDEQGNLIEPEKVDLTPKGGVGINPEKWILEFNKMAIADQASIAQTHNIYGTLGVLTKNEIRADIGRKPVEGGDQEMDAAGPEAPQPPDPADLGGIGGPGRGPSGTVSNPQPRRVGEQGAPTPANLDSVGIPVSKSGDPELRPEIKEEIIDKVSDGLNEAIFEVLQDVRKLSEPKDTSKSDDET